MARGKKTGGRKPGSKNRTASDIKTLAQSYGADAIETLASIFNSKEASDQARVAAVKELLDRGYGKPAQAVELKTPEPLAAVVEVIVRTREEAKDVLSRLPKADGVP